MELKILFWSAKITSQYIYQQRTLLTDSHFITCCQSGVILNIQNKAVPLSKEMQQREPEDAVVAVVGQQRDTLRKFVLEFSFCCSKVCSRPLNCLCYFQMFTQAKY